MTSSLAVYLDPLRHGRVVRSDGPGVLDPRNTVPAQDRGPDPGNTVPALESMPTALGSDESEESGDTVDEPNEDLRGTCNCWAGRQTERFDRVERNTRRQTHDR